MPDKSDKPADTAKSEPVANGLSQAALRLQATAAAEVAVRATTTNPPTAGVVAAAEAVAAAAGAATIAIATLKRWLACLLSSSSFNRHALQQLSAAQSDFTPLSRG